ncbi:DUF1292 domain-containing protein [Cohnella sp.]|uniref:DUF1292 domain-containing protein n=1 Tax=Cohnella sp. TaxID=1883426 RepID=UPI00356AE94D
MTDKSEGRSNTPTLKEIYGDYVDLQGEDGVSQPFRILTELTLNSKRYAVLQSEAMLQDDEIEVFRIVMEPDGEIGLESIADEDEWELVAEAYDDIQFGSDDQP